MDISSNDRSQLSNAVLAELGFDACPICQTTLHLLGTELSSSHNTIRLVVLWWLDERHPGEELNDFLHRTNIIGLVGRKTIELVASGAMNADDASLRLSPAARDRLRENIRRYRVPPSETSASNSDETPLRTPRPPALVVESAEEAPKAEPAFVGLQAGEVVGKYLIGERIAEGGHGIVYKATHLSLHMPVAIKALRLASPISRGSIEFKAFKNEARLLAQLNHPNIVRVLDFDDEGAVPWMALEFVNGQSLADLMRISGRFRQADALRVIYQCVDGLEIAQQLGVVHCDIKPANILLTRDGLAKITDFGVAHLCDSRWDHVTTRVEKPADVFIGSAAYASPEQARGVELDMRSDVYSLGVTFFESVTGRLPFEGDAMMQVLVQKVTEDPPLAREVCPRVHEKVSALIAKMMARNLDERFASYHDLREALVDVADALNVPLDSRRSLWATLQMKLDS